MSFTVYKSSAGSGKTYTLVLEYLKLVLPEPWRFRNILAITFTNKAANEMKERVLESLRALSDKDYQKKGFREQLLEKLSAETGLAKEIIQLKSGEALELILHHYSDFAIGTIDGFSHRIMRTFARDFGLSINFLVSLESETLRQEAVDILLNRAGEDKELTIILVKFLESMIDENNGWNIGHIMMKFSAVLEDEEIAVNLVKLSHLTLEDFRRIIAYFNKICREAHEEIIAPAIKAIDLIHEAGIDPDAFYRGKSGFYGYMWRISKGNLTNLEVKKYLSETLEEGKWFSPRASAEDQAKIKAIADELLALYEAFRSLKDNKLKVWRFVMLMRKTMYPMAVLNMLSSIFEEFKKQNNIVQVAEFNKRISSIITDEPVPFIYERLGERFRHILIDEFQDTSRLQWQNLLPLVENSLAGGNFNLVVGDGKQAIYRWRNGEVEQFVNLPSVAGSQSNPVIASRQQSLKNHFSEKSLGRNFRSMTEIVRFNNDFFDFIRNGLNPENAKVFSEVVQVADDSRKGGYVSLEFSMEEGLLEENCSRILEIIKDLEGRNYHRKDLAVLCRDNRSASYISRFLMENSIDVVSAESLLICFSYNVRYLINCLHFIDNPEEKFYQGEILTYLFRKKMLPASLPVLLERMNGKYPRKEFLAILHENGFELNLRHLSSLPLYDLCEELIRIFRMNDAPDVYLQFFLDAILKFTRQDPGGIPAFLDWWDMEKGKLSVVVPEGLDAVNVMTIHKAKGLQFPVVIYPLATQVMRASNKYMWIDIPAEQYDGLPAVMMRPEKQMLETPFAAVYNDEIRKSELDLINILYVALTRPEDELYILTSIPPKKSQSMNLPGIFADYLVTKGLWDESQYIYTFGNKGKRQDTSTGSNALHLNNFTSSSWRKKIRLRSNAPLTWDTDDPQRKRSRGNLVHMILSGIKTADDVPLVLTDSLQSGIISQDIHHEISSLVTNVVHHPEISDFFSNEKTIMTEAGILTADGSSYRPDRIVIHNGRVTLIDYKTGKDDQHHVQQLNNYEKLMNDLGFMEVKKYLLYLEPEIRLVEVQ